MKKFCICLMMLCIIEVISGCCNTCNTPQTGSDEQSDEASEKELEFSDVVSNRGLFMRTRILKDNKYGNEYIILESDAGVSICPRIRN